MNIYFKPRTKLGILSVWFLCVFVLSFLALMTFASFGQEGGNTFLDNLFLAIPGLIGMLSGVTMFVISLISIIKSKERSVFVFISTIFGFLVLLFILGEIFIPH